MVSTNPPDVGAQVIIAKAMPKPKAKPIWSNELNAGSVLLRKKEAVAAIPGKTADNEHIGFGRTTIDSWEHTIEEHSSCFCHHLAKPSWSCTLVIEFPLRDSLRRDNMTFKMSLDGFSSTQLQVILKVISTLMSTSADTPSPYGVSADWDLTLRKWGLKGQRKA